MYIAVCEVIDQTCFVEMNSEVKFKRMKDFQLNFHYKDSSEAVRP